jgi:transcriptional regulator with XRE-family HTH domain
MRFQDIIGLDTKLLGSRIREARERVGLSQEELAAAVSKDQGAISEYESGKRRLSATDLPALARALNVSLLYFYEGEVSGSDLDRAILHEFHQLPSTETKQAAIEIVRIFSDAMRLQSR